MNDISVLRFGHGVHDVDGSIQAWAMHGRRMGVCTSHMSVAYATFTFPRNVNSIPCVGHVSHVTVVAQPGIVVKDLQQASCPMLHTKRNIQGPDLAFCLFFPVDKQSVCFNLSNFQGNRTAWQSVPIQKTFTRKQRRNVTLPIENILKTETEKQLLAA